MQLTLFTDYALRVLIYAARNSDVLVTMKEISDFYGISADHLRKVIHSLSKTGYIKSYRGKKGGLELAYGSENIRIGDVVRDMEGNPGIIDCEGRDCLLASDCSLKSVLNNGVNAFYAELNKFTLQDVAGSPRMNQFFPKQ
jgi:Rrf2 family nitric oxide-sensitive transcriptional repressor